MTSNSIAIVEREMAAAQIEGVDFGSKLWIIARSPTTVLAWVYSHSSSINGFRHYYGPHLLILPDRTSSFMSRPKYISLRHAWTRLTAIHVRQFKGEIVAHFGSESWTPILDAISTRKTVVIEGGGGKLMPHPKLWGHAYSDWIKNPDNGFLPKSEVTKGSRYKLGYKETVND